MDIITYNHINYIKSNIDNIVDNIPKGNFKLIFDPSIGKYLDDVYNALEVTSGGWEFMRDDPPPNKGYMLWNNDVIKRIEYNMKYINELKFGTFGSIMIEMEDISILGWNKFIRIRLLYILEFETTNRKLFINNILNILRANDSTIDIETK